jgi:hypothetical protein
MRRQRLCRIMCIRRSFAPVTMCSIAGAAMEHRLVGEAFGPQEFLELDQPSMESGA